MLIYAGLLAFLVLYLWQGNNGLSRVSRISIIEGYHDASTGNNRAAFNNLCLTCKPYGNVNDVLYWWKYQPFYWQRQYQHCDKYGCGGSHDRSNCPIEFDVIGQELPKNSSGKAKLERSCATAEAVAYEPSPDDTGKTDPLFYQNRAAFCGKNPAHINCPNSFTGQKPTNTEPWSTTQIFR